jgi:hypothetical protein
MRVTKDHSFDSLRLTLPLRHCCEDCAYFDDQQQRCAHEWPTAEHRLADYAEPGHLSVVNFCKEFELR